jgi:hypothetical protein
VADLTNRLARVKAVLVEWGEADYVHPNYDIDTITAVCTAIYRAIQERE